MLHQLTRKEKKKKKNFRKPWISHNKNTSPKLFKIQVSLRPNYGQNYHITINNPQNKALNAENAKIKNSQGLPTVTSVRSNLPRRRESEAGKRRGRWARARPRGGGRAWCSSCARLGFLAPLSEPTCPLGGRGFGTSGPTIWRSGARSPSSRRTVWSCSCASLRSLISLALS